MQKYLHDHFLSEDNDGLLNNVEITYLFIYEYLHRIWKSVIYLQDKID